jgi:hypothetical protein
MTDNGGDTSIAQRGNQGQTIPDFIEIAKSLEIDIVRVVPSRCPAIPAPIGCDDMKSGGRQRQHDLAPAESQLGKSMQQEHGRTSGAVKAGLQQVHRQPVDISDAARPYAGWQRVIASAVLAQAYGVSSQDSVAMSAGTGNDFR